MKKIKGQNLRLGFEVENELKYIAGALTFDLSIEVDTEESTTKDSTANFKEYEAVMKGWSGSGQCRLAKDAEDLTGIQGWDISDLVGQTLHAEFNEVQGDQNRETSVRRKEGDIIITSWKIASSNKEAVNVDFSFQGTGELKNAGPVIGGPSEIILLPTATAKSAAFPASDGSAISKSTDADWLTLSGSGNNITFTPTAYAHASSGADPRVALVTITTANGGKKVVAVKQPMAAS